MTLRLADSAPDASSFIELEQLASEPYWSFVFDDAVQSRNISTALLAKGAGEFASPFGRTLLNADGETVGMVAGPLSRKELARARIQAAQVIHKSGLLQASPGVGARIALARETLLTLNDEDQYLSRIAVDPAARRQGVARFLLEAFLTKARANGGKRAVLEVSPAAEAAIRLYESAGFATVTEIRVDDSATGRSLAYLHMMRTL